MALRPATRMKAEQAQKLYAKGLSMAAIGKQIGVSYTRVNQLLTALGATKRHETRSPKLRGQKRKRMHLAWDLREQGMSYPEIAKTLGVSIPCVYRYRQQARDRATWYCPLCGERLPTPASLARHKELAHG